jgi:YtkA-like
MRKVLLLAAAVVLGALLAGALLRERSGAEVEDAVVVGSTRGLYEVSVSPTPSGAVVNRLHSWQLDVRGAEGDPVPGADISVRGDMPAHGHGLPTQPRVREMGDGRYEVDGVKFQMGGAWYVEFEIAAAAGTDVARVDFVLPG